MKKQCMGYSDSEVTAALPIIVVPWTAQEQQQQQKQEQQQQQQRQARLRWQQLYPMNILILLVILAAIATATVVKSEPDFERTAITTRAGRRGVYSSKEGIGESQQRVSYAEGPFRQGLSEKERLLQQERRRQLQQLGSASSMNLPFGDINVIALTDVHSWLGGRGTKDPHYNADYGDVLSFYQRVKQHCLENGNDLWFVMNGDWIDGTGLALNGDPSHLIPLLQKMPWDALNIGNHELYERSVIDYMSRPAGFIEWWGDKYLSSNVVYSDQADDPQAAGIPLGSLFKFLRGNKYTVLAFGFLYDMTDNDSAVLVKQVESVVQESWFLDALRQGKKFSLHAVLVLAHMDVRDPLVTIILNAIRNELGSDMPVQFITGHTHKRDYQALDEYAASVEPGYYLDTVGFVSFPAKGHVVTTKPPTPAPVTAPAATPAPSSTAGNSTTASGGGGGGRRVRRYHHRRERLLTDESNSTAGAENETTPAPAVPAAPAPAPAPAPAATTTSTTSPLFKHVFLDANVGVLSATLGIETTDFPTDDGTALSHFIYRTQEELGLHEVIGCATQDYYLNSTLTYTPGGKEYQTPGTSLWQFFQVEVVPTMFTGKELFLLEKGTFKYDLLEGDLTVDNVYQISPFNETLYVVHTVPGNVILQVQQKLNEDNYELSKTFLPNLPMYIEASTSPPFGPTEEKFDLITDKFSMPKVQAALDAILTSKSFTEGADYSGAAPVVVNTTNSHASDLDLGDEHDPGFPDLKPKASTDNNSNSNSMQFELFANGAITTSSIWMDFFLKSTLCTTKNMGKHKKHKTTTGGKNTGDTNKYNDGTNNSSSMMSPEKIKSLEIAVGILAAVLALGCCLVTLCRHYQRLHRDRDSTALEALREYEDNFDACESAADSNGSDEFTDTPDAAGAGADHEHEHDDFADFDGSTYNADATRRNGRFT